ncbi:MAG: galactose-1-phosphate uridylyltransferase, partial [Patescibacteria group bacterium]
EVAERVIDKNEHFITLIPFASRVSYETRIYPIQHAARFEDLDKDLFTALAESLKNALSRLNKIFEGLDYNFFIHTAPVEEGYDHYHWHLEILPRGFDWAGLELGGGIEVILVPPEEAADNLRKI